MSHPRPTTENTEKINMKKTPVPPILPSPIHEQQNKKPKVKTITLNTLPHIVPLPSDGNAGNTKFIQVSPLTILPKQEIPKFVKLQTIPQSGQNIPDSSKLQISNQGIEASNITVLKSTKNIPVASGHLQVLPTTSKKSVSGNIDTNLPLSSDTNTNTPTNQASVTKRIPTIIQKRTSTNTPKNIADIKNKNIAPSTMSSGRKRSYDEVTSESKETTIKEKKIKTIKERQPAKTKPNKTKEIEEEISEKNKIVAVKSKKNKRKRGKRDSQEFTLPMEYIYVANGFRVDVDTFIEKCMQASKLNFEKFTNVWKEMEFSSIFHRRESSPELAELSEEVIHVAKQYMLAKNVSFEENVAGLFLVYALLHHQPFPKFASLRLVPKDVPPILSLETQARREKRNEVLYVLANVLIKGPCQYHVLEREVSLEPPYRKYFDNTVQTAVHLNCVITRNSECAQQLNKMTSLEHRYQKQRQQCLETRKACTRLGWLTHQMPNMVNNPIKNVAANLLELYRGHIPGAKNSDDTDEAMNNLLSPTGTWKSSEERADLLKLIKDKAMGASVEGMRHLTGVKERKQDSSSSESEESEREVKPRNRKRRVRGKGRSSARNLEELFRVYDTAEEIAKSESSESGYEMPSLSDVEDLSFHTDYTNEQFYKKKPNTRPHLNINDYFENQSASKKRTLKTYTFSPKARSNQMNADLISVKDLFDNESPTFTEVDSNDDDDEGGIMNIRRKIIAKNLSSNRQQEVNRETYSSMPSITIEFENMNENPAVQRIDKTIKTYQRQKKSNAPNIKPFDLTGVLDNTASSKDVTGDETSNKASTIDEADKTPSNKIPESVNAAISKITSKDDTAAIKDDKGTTNKETTKLNEDLETDNINVEIPKQYQPKKKDSSAVPVSHGIEPGYEASVSTELDANKSRRESPRIKNLLSPKTDEQKSAPGKGKNTACEGEGHVEVKKTKFEPKIKVRLKSSLQKLGVLEVATDGAELIKKVRQSTSKKSKSKKK